MLAEGYRHSANGGDKNNINTFSKLLLAKAFYQKKKINYKPVMF